MIKADIVVWLNTPPVACRGVFNELIRLLKGNVIIMCADNLTNERYLIKSQKDNYIEGQYIKFDVKDILFLQNFIEQHKNDFHIFNGYKGVTAPIIDKVYEANKKSKIIIWAERPAFKGSGIKKNLFAIPYWLSHYFSALKYRKKVCAFLALGEIGVENYKKLGWPAEKLFPFMYSPIMEEKLSRPLNNSNNYTKFVYVGRFRKMWKGVGVLMDAFDLISNEKFTITMVGGYGENKEDVFKWIENRKYAILGGTWPIDEVSSRLQDYDVCVVPSCNEGWNVTVNQAIMAGIGCICTDQAVSNELIKKSGSGIIVNANNPKELAEAMRVAIRNPSLVKEWKEKAYVYKKKISSETCAKYLIDVLKYLEDHTTKPTPTWLNS